MSKAWLVLKFGGTSVSGLEQWKTIAGLARRRLDDGHRVVLVCSAVAGITDVLQGLADQPGDKVSATFEIIRQRHLRLAQELDIDAGDLVAQALERIELSLEHLIAEPDNERRYAWMTALLSQGEWLSTKIGERFLAKHAPVAWVDVREALRALPENDLTGRRSWLNASCDSEVDRQLVDSWSLKPRLLITQGFIAEHPTGGIALLGRGGSDTSAALLAGRLAASRIEIWTDVPGLFSADPRVLPQARLLQELTYAEALEMAASGAKVVHSRCIRAAADSGIPLLVRDLGRPGFKGTTISADGAQDAGVVEGIRAVCRQPKMAVLLLQNLDTREHVGFLAWVFTQISAAGLSVDQVATSETTTTLALNRTSNRLDDTTLKKLATCLEVRCAVTVYPRCSGINLVGRGARVALANLDAGAGFFANHPLLMLSQSANDLCISLLLREGDARQLLLSLHRSLVEDTNQATEGIFGPRWQDILD